nr:MAG TPA: Integrase [Caudoviricetes sp.]
MKRANGTGSVYKRTDKKRRKPYVAMVTIGTNQETGRPIRKSLGSFEKATEAWKVIEQYIQGPQLFKARDITFSKMWDLMIQQKVNMGVSSAYNYNMTKNRCQHIWNIPIQDIRLAQLQDIVDTCGLSPASKRQIKVTLNAVFSLAYANDYIVKNYAELIQLPPLGKSDMHKPFTTEEMRILWQHTDDPMARTALCYCYTGARPVELMAMKVEDVNLKERYMVGGVKTAAGKNRRIPIADCIYPFIKEWCDAKWFQGGTFLPFDTQGKLRHNWDKSLQTMGITDHRPHDGRHTFATLASNYGLDEVTVKRIVGHSRGRNITQDVYTHKTQEQLLNAVNQLPYGPDMTISPDEKVVATASKNA